jgi:hypothetical protein
MELTMPTSGRTPFLVPSVFVLIMAVFACGCASPAKVSRMRAQAVLVPREQPFSVGVEAQGGKETNPALNSEISNDSFAEAIRNSIIKFGVFRSVVTTDNGDYLLKAQIFDDEKPMFGLDMTMKMSVDWTIIHTSTQKIVFETTTYKSFTATMGDALVGITRLRLAEEGAARENIEDGLNQISQLKLNGKE